MLVLFDTKINVLQKFVFIYVNSYNTSDTGSDPKIIIKMTKKKAKLLGDNCLFITKIVIYIQQKTNLLLYKSLLILGGIKIL
jgi:hypothetical protein